MKIDKAETVGTYTVTPTSRSVFSASPSQTTVANGTIEILHLKGLGQPQKLVNISQNDGKK